MFTAREFINPFSYILNNCNENFEDGVNVTIERFKQFIQIIELKLREGNIKLLEKFKDEDPSVRSNVLGQPENMNSLYFFNDLILKSTVVSIYSYLEYKLMEISKITEAHLKPKKTINSFKHPSGKRTKTPSSIEAYNSFLISEIIPELDALKTDFQELLNWKELRVQIVHSFSKEPLVVNEFIATHSSMKIEDYGLIISDSKNVIEYLDLIERYLATIVSLINTKFSLIKYD